MKRKFFSSFVLVTVTIVACAVLTFSQTRDENEIFNLVNRERSRAHLGELSWDERLAKVARDYSRRMAREGFFDHYDPNGKTVIDRADRVPGWKRIGENLFVCDDQPYYTTVAIRGWMKSPTHRTNILDRTWTATGIGIATARDGSIFITQVFTSE
jgi:uncharacterized protein YkwD